MAINLSKNDESVKRAVARHDVDSSIFQGRYVNFEHGRYTDEFIYGRYQLFEELDRVLNRLAPKSRVLDLGCGTGHFADYVQRRGFSVVGVDPSTKMLAFARKNFPSIEFIEGYSSKLPFPADHFDCIICIEVLRYLDRPEVLRSYEEIKRTLRSGGTLLVTHVNTLATEAYFVYYHLKRLAGALRGRKTHRAYFTSAAKEERILRDLGFYEIEAIGRMAATIRIGYKFGHRMGRAWARGIESLDRTQRTTSGVHRNLRGHLVLIARKG